MKHSFSRFFGLGEKEQEPEIAEHDTNKEEILEIPVNAIVPNRFQPRTISQMKNQRVSNDHSYTRHYSADCC